MNLYQSVQSEIKKEVELNKREKELQEREKAIYEKEKEIETNDSQCNDSENLREQIRNSMYGVRLNPID